MKKYSVGFYKTLLDFQIGNFKVIPGFSWNRAEEYAYLIKERVYKVEIFESESKIVTLKLN